jgi:DNA-binding YbaB/EbfC family protein
MAMNPNNLGDMVRQVARMRKDMEAAQEDLKSRYVEAEAGGGLIDVTVNGRQDLVKITIDPKALGKGTPDDVSLLEDLIIAAVSQGMEKSRALMKEEMEKVTGGLGGLLPGMF